MREEQTTNYYALLELSPTATDAELKKAWHEQIQASHPDRFGHAPTPKRLDQAYFRCIQ